MKSGDEYTVPLCHACHMALHAFGDERLWWDLLGIDPLDWAKSNYEAWRGDKNLNDCG